MDVDADNKQVKVLAIASHVVYGYVGNKVVTFVLQSMGFDVSGISTVNFSNHTGYRQFKGRRNTAEEIWELYTGLQQSHLDDYDMLISGYIPSPEGVEAVGRIAKDLSSRSKHKPGSFFWVLDPVMGDGGSFYVDRAEAPIYRSLLPSCHLLLPNQFELETLTETTITDMPSLVRAVGVLHREFHVPHVFVTSTQLAPASTALADESKEPEVLTLLGSTATSTHAPRTFSITAPYYPAMFNGTGDTFAALVTARLREECSKESLLAVDGWISPDSVRAGELPLARAAKKVVSSMQAVLAKTWMRYEREVARAVDGEEEKEKRLRLTKGLELQVVGNVGILLDPPAAEGFKVIEVSESC